MKRLLLVVNYQNDFVDGSMGVPGSEKLESPLANKIIAYREAHDDVAFVANAHHRNYSQTLEASQQPVAHCVEGTPGHKFYGEVGELVRECDTVFYTPTPGAPAFFKRCRLSQAAADAVGKKPFASIEIVGLFSNTSILANAILARTACPEVPVLVDAACTVASEPTQHEKALDLLEGLQIQVVNRADRHANISNIS